METNIGESREEEGNLPETLERKAAMKKSGKFEKVFTYKSP